MRYAWIAEHGKSFVLSEMCEVLDVSVSGYRAWKRGGIGACSDTCFAEEHFSTIACAMSHQQLRQD